MSIGIDHIGPMTISAQKNAAPSDRMINEIVVAKTGSRQTNEPRNPIITTLRRALLQIAGALEDAVADRAAEIVADRRPAKNTADEKSADFRRSNWYSCRK